MRKWGLCIFLSAICSLSLIGCGSEKLDISEEDEERVKNYAATVLAEHSGANNRSLAVLSERDLERIVKLDLAAAAAEQAVETEEAEAEVQENAGNENPEEAGNSAGSDSGENSGEAEKSIAEAIGLSDFDISYNGYEITDNYPDSEEEGVFALTPGSDQDSLLVVHFNVFNPNSEMRHCDILHIKPSFRINISGQRHGLLTTLLLNDLAMLDQDIEAGETFDAVLVAEISDEKAADISSLGLIVRGDDGNYEISLE